MNKLLTTLLVLIFIGQGFAQEDNKSFKEKLPFELNGFIHTRHATRIVDDPYQEKDLLLSESRLQTILSDYNNWFEWKIKSDFVYDGFKEKFLIDLREANVQINTPYWLGIKAGRQILTWGKGDMLFVNDLFPKDWQSFFIGRELEYLKAPSDALKLSLYIEKFEFNFIYTPSFDPDIFPTGERLSFYDRSIETYRSNESQIEVLENDKWFKNDEINWRLRRNIGSYDLAFYGYYGYWKSPGGIDLDSFKPFFPRMISHGLSFEGGLLGGIFSMEAAWYHSPDDPKGDLFNINNSNFRYIIGQNFDLKKEWNIGVQYYSEIILNYNAYKSNFPNIAVTPNRTRDMFTLRVGKNLFRQKANLSLFNYYGIAEKDNYTRINFYYKHKDVWKIDIGANIFSGDIKSSFWNQFGYNDNVYIGLKWSY